MSMAFNFLALLILTNHAIYISVIELSISDGVVEEMQVKIFADDMADAVRAVNGAIIPINEQYSEEHLSEIELYFRQHLFIKNESTNKYFSIKSYSREDQASWDFSIKSYSREDQASWFVLALDEEIEEGDVLVADYLMELFANQTNMLRLKILDRQLFHQLKKGKAEYGIGKVVDKN